MFVNSVPRPLSAGTVFPDTLQCLPRSLLLGKRRKSCAGLIRYLFSSCSDVLRDHFSRCDRRGNSAIPSSLDRGRKRHACDECSRLKVKCDSNVPCKKCKEFGRACVKRRPTSEWIYL